MKKILTIALILMGSLATAVHAVPVQEKARQLSVLIDSLKRVNDTDSLAKVLEARTVFFFNNGLSDSIKRHAPQDLAVLKSIQNWDRYYGLWTSLINTYIYYDNSKNKALREVETMFNDAMQRQHQYGLAIAYYTMGNVYLNMNNLDQSAEAYQKSLAAFMSLPKKPSLVLDLYSYYGDVLNEQQKFSELDTLTIGWKTYLTAFIEENKNLSTDQLDILWFYYYIACAQSATGLNNYKDADLCLDNAEKLINHGIDYIVSTWLTCKADLRLKQGRLAEALQLNDQRLQLVRTDEDRAVYLTVIRQRADIFSRMGQYAKSSPLYKEIYLLRDSISSADTRNQLNEMNTLFKVDELEREQEQLKMQQERAQFRNTLIIVGIVLIGLIVFIVFRIIAARRLKKAHEQLEKTHDELEKTHSDLLTAYDQLEETTAAKERIESDLRIARNIQMGMVPSTFPDRPDVDLYASMTPAKEVGGDLYGYYLTGDKLYFALGDVSGKGVPASLFMAQATRLFRTLAAQEMKPAEIATRINDALSGEDNETCMFVTMFLGLVDLTTGHLDFCNAGHNPPVLLTDGKAEFIEMIPNTPIGLFPGMEYEGEEIADISGKPLFVYTDGLNEAENRQQEQFTDERLLDMLEKTPFQSACQTIEMLRQAVEQHRDGAEPNDDLTMLCVRVSGRQQ